MTDDRKMRDRWGERGAFRPASRVRTTQNQEELGVLSPLLEFLPPSPPPIGLLDRIEHQIDEIDRERLAVEVSALEVHWGWRVLGAGLLGALIGAAAMAVALLADPASTGPGGELLPLSDQNGADAPSLLGAKPTDLGDHR